MSLAFHTTHLANHIEALIRIAVAQGGISELERDYIHKVAARVELDRALLDKFMSDFVAAGPSAGASGLSTLTERLAPPPLPGDCIEYLHDAIQLMLCDHEIADEELETLNAYADHLGFYPDAVNDILDRVTYTAAMYERAERRNPQITLANIITHVVATSHPITRSSVLEYVHLCSDNGCAIDDNEVAHTASIVGRVVSHLEIPRHFRVSLTVAEQDEYFEIVVQNIPERPVKDVWRATVAKLCDLINFHSFTAGNFEFLESSGVGFYRRRQALNGFSPSPTDICHLVCEAVTEYSFWQHAFFQVVHEKLEEDELPSARSVHRIASQRLHEYKVLKRPITFENEFDIRA